MRDLAEGVGGGSAAYASPPPSCSWACPWPTASLSISILFLFTVGWWSLTPKTKQTLAKTSIEFVLAVPHKHKCECWLICLNPPFSSQSMWVPLQQFPKTAVRPSGFLVHSCQHWQEKLCEQSMEKGGMSLQDHPAPRSLLTWNGKGVMAIKHLLCQSQHLGR